MRGLISVIIGIVFIIGGLTGKLVLMGTQSGMALAVVGAVILGIGVFAWLETREQLWPLRLHPTHLPR